MWQSIAEQIACELETPFAIKERTIIAGDDNNHAYHISDGSRSLFVKTNNKSHIDPYEVEAQGLKTLLASQTIRVPHPICYGKTKTHSFLVLEYLNFEPATPESWYKAGIELAALHSHGEQAMYGADEDNYIGPTVQPNSWQRKWCQFFAEQRIGWQLQLLQEKGILLGDIEELIARIKQKLAHHQPRPSLLHGDLWNGNIAFCQDGQPVIYDPACYWGDREVDIAMTELFGRLPQSFYEGYLSEAPLDEGYGTRRDIYNFYHILNHCNIFGDAYLSQAKQLTQQILEAP
ncbi:fructosamine kinase family protein [Dongshaea marina]|uniref:fructosamine kinase family protein n=1 Tax=Dongshaea marina TaxID=2047966 RepID=UPI000D3E86E4|nr:fructosamine kinase family protein [Dongshaea marina]